MTNPVPLQQPAASEHTWRRRLLLHVTAALINAALALGLGRWTAVYIVAAGGTIMALTEVLRLAVPAVNRRYTRGLGSFMKPREATSPTGAMYHTAGSLAVLVLFDTPIAALAILYMGLGDPAASFIGERYGRLRVRLLGNRLAGKSIEGTLAFLAVSLAAAAVLWAAGVYPVFWPALVGAAVAALVEFLPLPLDDNVTVPLASGIVMWLLWVA